MNNRILIVDDEPNVLLSYKRSLRKKYVIDTAQSGAETLQKLSDGERYAVIVADMQMPNMNGVQLLEKVKNIDPDMVRIMLTGNADQQTAIDAINRGDIYRFLNKPCSAEMFAQAVDSGIRHHELLTVEHELLDKTLSGSIRVLAEVLSLANPQIFGRTARLQKLMRQVVEQLDIEKEWWVEPMVLLSQIGCVILPDKVSRKVAEGTPLATDDFQLYRKHPAVGASLLEKIPRMETISTAIRFQEKCYDGTGTPVDETKGKDIPFGARLLKVILDYEHAESMGLNIDQALARMYRQSKWYDPDILNALRDAVLHKVPMVNRKISVDDLYEGLVLAEDLRTTTGILLISKGNPLTLSALHRLEEYKRAGLITGAIYVSMPTDHLYMARHDHTEQQETPDSTEDSA